MVSLTRIYTKSGDKGKTSLGNGTRLQKDHARIQAIGSVDEANSSLGLVRLYIHEPEQDMFARIQNDLFDVGADLCMPTDIPDVPSLRVTSHHVDRLEKDIDTYNASLSPLTSFVLPAGSQASSFLHLTRTIVRRAERDVVHLVHTLATETLEETKVLNPCIQQYLNRLSDLCFVMARFYNDHGKKDVLWKPGANAASEQQTDSS